jgi:hypothetical protein
VQIFWGIDKPNIVGQDAVFAFTKLGKYMLEMGEGWLFRSDNLLTEADPEQIRWELLPLGDRGIRKEEFGSVQEEHNLVPIGEQDLYCVYRTTMGFPCHAYSRDGGRTWTEPEPMTYAPGGRMVKTPRACPMLWRTSDGRLLFWFHHNGVRSFHSRNPAWIAGGIVRDGHVHWSEPEVLLYDPDPKQRMSYPDLIEQDGRFWVTETQKTEARVHEIDRTLLEGLWTQGESKAVSRDGLIADLDADALAGGPGTLAGEIDLSRQTGLTIDVWLDLREIVAGQVLLTTRDAAGRGFSLTVGPDRNVQLDLNDGQRQASWTSDAGTLQAGRLQHVVAIVDSGPQLISFVIDGRLGDGGQQREYGWTRYPEALTDVRGSGSIRCGDGLANQVKHLRLYNRYLRTSEAVAHFHAGLPGTLQDKRRAAAKTATSPDPRNRLLPPSTFLGCLRNNAYGLIRSVPGKERRQPWPDARR